MTDTKVADDAGQAVTPVAVEAELPVVTDPEAPGEWFAVHVFYTSNNHPLLVDAIAPVVEAMRDEGLLSRWFFIRYWMEGPHLRVRLKPTRAGDTEVVAKRLFTALDEFLADRPALYEVDEAEMGGLFKQMFLGEYTEEQWDELYGAEGMRMRPNNSYTVMLYEPEISRYGGKYGIEVAERHFEKSSDMVLRLVESTNVHVRPVLFGLAIQLMTVMLGTFQQNRDESVRFLSTYRSYWERAGDGDVEERHRAYIEAYGKMSSDLHVQLDAAYKHAVNHEVESLSGFVREWAEHCVELREELVGLAEQGRLEFPIAGAAESNPVDLDTALFALLSGYIHMTNNRLGVSIIDECYLSFLLELTLTGGELLDLEANLGTMFGGTGADR